MTSLIYLYSFESTQVNSTVNARRSRSALLWVKFLSFFWVFWNFRGCPNGTLTCFIWTLLSHKRGAWATQVSHLVGTRHMLFWWGWHTTPSLFFHLQHLRDRTFACLIFQKEMSEGKRLFLPWLHPNCFADACTHSMHAYSVRGGRAPSLDWFKFSPLPLRKSVHTTEPDRRASDASAEVHTVHTALVKKFAVSIHDVNHTPRHTLREQGHQIIAQKDTLRTQFPVCLVLMCVFSRI